MSNNSYRFFQNKECRFFPCHSVKDEDEFNCLFCYCPLYLDDNCIGSPEYVMNGKGQRIKDCSSCLVVHRPEMYDKVIAHLCRQEELLEIDLRKINGIIKDRVVQIAHIDDMEEDMRGEHRRMAGQVVDKLMMKHERDTSDPGRVVALLQPFAGECVHEDYLELGNKKIECHVLRRFVPENIEKGYLYTFHAPEIDMDSAESVLEQYYMESFQIASMDVIREWIQGYLERKNSIYEKKYCSPSLGPGYYGMSMDAVPELLGLMDASKVGIAWTGERMSPKMSLAGVYLIAKQNVFGNCLDCENCIGGQGGCDFCKNTLDKLKRRDKSE